MPPPSQLEVVAFWIVGIVITILSGGVAIYASHLAVEAARASGCDVIRIVGTLSEETVERLGIQPGQARPL
jgi:hypothetical protein